jgi:nucleotide sugar dehydrogenase
MNKVCVAGLGVVGYPTALYVSNHGFSVYGYDIDEKKVKEIKSHTPFKVVSEWSEIPNVQIYVVCVSTGWKDDKPDMSAIFDVCSKISKKGGNPLVCIESTVSVGTCRKLAELFDNEVHLVHVPHRYWSGNPEEYGVKQKRVIGALDKASLDRGMEFYKKLEIPLHPVSSLEIAEVIKITENAYRFVQIAFVEELKLLCEKNNIPFEEVREGANTKWNIELLEARNGIGGECLPKDIRYLSSLGENFLLTAAIKADKSYKEYLKKGDNKFV